ncbi:MAG: Toluene-4-sulfonate monooxygenase system iron-sulfur subunit TsaM1 [Alphaproteobacteria bacterium MarineAlpha11_Bin1]|nr:MAG: Toluene-4-sulfonate monooxygenase system iron-sulfur subunit TsaM1 [Alphaproteobacteria bacterium MarineAlpha11_Bin1]|tara:strand:- start:10017 stop:11093 length:1077 start_codon:yes stop_codon:yes gene_type:complete
MGAFLKNSWYAAAWNHEVSAERPMARTILNEPIVFFRDTKGQVVALEDRCCHRHLPLSEGKIIGDNLECGYHGLTFDTSGACVRVPGQTRVPPESRVRAWPVIEKYQYVWVWMGEPAEADESQLPDWHVMDDPQWAVVKGDPPFHIQCHYELFNDNLLDLSHLAYVHVKNIGTSAVPDFPIVTKKTEDTVQMIRWILDSPPAPLYAHFGGFKENIDRWQYAEARVPSLNTVRVGCLPAGCGAKAGDHPDDFSPKSAGRNGQGFEFYNLNAITPETENSTWYFYAHSRNFAQEDPDMDEEFRRELRGAFQEDVDILSAQQMNMRRHDHNPKKWIDINVDGPGLALRRMVADAIAAETRN